VDQGPDHPTGDDTIQSLARGLAVIRSFDAEHPAQTLSEVARRTGLSRATARRVLHTLRSLGYADVDGRQFTLSPRVLDLGYAYLSSQPLSDLIEPFIEQLSAELHESVSVAVLDDCDIIYVARVATSRLMTIAIGIGSRLPAPTTSMGRVLLADLPNAERRRRLAEVELPRRTDMTITTKAALLDELDRVADQGWALMDQELELGVRSIAAPVRDRSGRAVAAMNVATHAGRTSVEEIHDRFLPALVTTARDVSDALASR